MVGPLRAISFFASQMGEEEEYNPWHRLAEAELMVGSHIKINWQLTSFLSPFLPLFRPQPLPTLLLVLDLCAFQ